jgi:iron complex transport system substrate-binding protein
MRSMTLSRRGLATLSAALALPAMPARAQIALRDAAGRAVTLPRTPERIVLAFNFEEFSAVAGPGGWDRVVGINRRQWAINRPAVWRHHLATMPRLADLPDIGAAENQTMSAERIIALRPDLLIIHAWGYQAQADVMARVEQAGIPVVCVDYNAQTQALHRAGTLALGAALGRQDRAVALADLYDSKVEALAARVARVTQRPASYVELGSGGPQSVGNSYAGTMWGRMIELAGGRNIAEGRIRPGWAPLPPETVLGDPPDHVFLVGATWNDRPSSVRAGYGVTVAEARASVAPYAQRAGWAALPAVRNGNVSVLESGLARSLMDWIGMQFMAKRLHPEAFGDLDPGAELARWHAEWLPVPFDGAWLVAQA